MTPSESALWHLNATPFSNFWFTLDAVDRLFKAEADVGVG